MSELIARAIMCTCSFLHVLYIIHMRMSYVVNSKSSLIYFRHTYCNQIVRRVNETRNSLRLVEYPRTECIAARTQTLVSMRTSHSLLICESLLLETGCRLRDAYEKKFGVLIFFGNWCCSHA